MEKFSNNDAEQKILGILIEYPERITDLKISPIDFYNKFHGDVFEKILEMVNQGKKVTVTHLKDLFAGDDNLKFVGDTSYFDELVESVIDSSMLYEFVKMVSDMSLRRSLYVKFKRLHDDFKPNTDPYQVLNEFLDLQNSGEVRSLSQSQVFDQIKDDLTRDLPMYKTGLKRLDECMGGGLYESYLYGFAGAEKSGKTTLAHTISFNLKCRHTYVAMEMGSKQIEQKNISRKLGINPISFISDYRKSVIPKLTDDLRNDNRFYLDAAGWTWNDIKRSLMNDKIKNGIKGFIIDYWQLIQDSDGRETEERAMRRTAQEVANFCRQTKLWCVMLAQMNKDGDLFGGGGLKKACDQLYFIEKYKDDEIRNRWIRMGASRYTMFAHCGTEENPAFFIHRDGTHFEQHEKF